MQLGAKLPASAGTYEMEQMDLSGVNESWKGKNVKYTITRHPSAFNDTIELSFTGILKQVLPADKNDSAVITGKMRAVYVSVP
ncbi:hypothetical protein [Chitinophaga rhizophila]|uniref:YceI-like domain-containing protein n=1 Tax=Chitinophaga rhizophila TaxID=2866212 RepID=A0ABS7GE24_9BACT|nr:hypothetical protein [Chitinophaga rhizophila]MBW8685671.1 hypothetical protein [Chitinophaga rhizophila]